MLLTAAIERLYDLNVGITPLEEGAPHEKPHKPLLLLAAFDLNQNHHWAMDRNLIAPAPDHHWHVSKILDPRRSNGEKELIELSGKSLLLPQDQAFHPDREGLSWRLERLIA